MKKNDVIMIRPEKMINSGQCLGRIDSLVVIVNGCLPGELVKARITRIKKDLIEADSIEIVETIPDRKEPICKYFGLCGGCSLQNLEYSKQLNIKRIFIEDAFNRIAKLYGIEIPDVLPAEKIYFYRNKMEYSFAKRWLFKNTDYTEEQKNFALGLHVPKVFEKVIHLDECFLQSEFSNKVRKFVAEFLFDRKVSIHSLKNKQGLLKALSIRESYYTNEKMVSLITTRYEEKLINSLAEELKIQFPEIESFVNIISSPDLSSTLPEKILTIYGKGFIIEKLFGYEFEIFPNTFFQTNTAQAEKLFDVIIQYLIRKNTEINRDHYLIDLYSGVGVIGIVLSRYFNKVFCYEEVYESVEAAKRNAKRNYISNIEFVRQNLNDGFGIGNDVFGKKLTLVVDPPRSGLSRETLNCILEIKPKTIFYISCNPITQARDIQNLKDFYKINLIQPIDLFPQTLHVENIVILEIF